MFFIMVLFFLIYVSYAVALDDPKYFLESSQIGLRSVLEQYNDFEMVVHVDVWGLNLLRDVSEYTDKGHVLTIFFYDSTCASAATLRRPSRPKCANVVILNDTTCFFIFIQQVDNVYGLDVILFFFQNMDSWMHNVPHLYGTGVDGASVTFLVDTHKAKALYFYHHPLGLVDVFNVTINDENVPQMGIFYNTFDDFYAYPMKIGYTEVPPFTDNLGSYIAGIEYGVLTTILKMLNITAVYMDYTVYADSRMQIIKDVHAGILHLGVGSLTNSVVRDKLVSFSGLLGNQPYIAIYSVQPNYEQSVFNALISAMKWQAWVAAIITFFAIIISLKLLHSYEQRRYELHYALIPISIFIEQSVMIPQRNVIRIALFGCIAIGMCFSNAYKSKLTSVTVSPKTEEPNALVDLYNDDFSFETTSMDTQYLYEVLKYVNGTVEYDIGNKLIASNWVCPTIERLLTEKIAIIEEQPVLRFYIWNVCQKNISSSEFHKLRRLDKPVAVSGHRWAMSKFAPFKRRISRTIVLLHAYGLISSWYNKPNISRALPVSNTVRNRGAMVPLSIMDVASSFVILAIGSVISILGFLIERLYSSTTRKETQLIYCN